MTTAIARTPSAATCRAICGTVRSPSDLLAAGHRDRVVEEDLERDVDAGRHRLPDRELAGVEVGAVAHVLEDVAGRR